MWIEHDKIREMKKSLHRLLDIREEIGFQKFVKQLCEATISLAEMLSNHFYKENNILFPTALEVIGAGEWEEVRKQFNELGYCRFTPEPAEMTVQAEIESPKPRGRGMIPFETGSLSREEMECLLNTLPVDITFVDREDTVRYFSQLKHRIFPRTRAVTGRKVQQYHLRRASIRSTGYWKSSGMVEGIRPSSGST